MKHVRKKWVRLVCMCLLCCSLLSMSVFAEEQAGAEDVTESSGETMEEDLYDGLDPDAVVMTVGKDEVKLRKAYFLMKYQQAIVQDMMKGVYGGLWYSLPLFDGEMSFQDSSRESVCILLAHMSLARQKSDELGVKLSEEEKESIETVVDAFFACNSEEALQAMMADRETVSEVLTDYTILVKVLDKVTKDTEAESEAFTYSYVIASFADDAGKSVEEFGESSLKLVEDYKAIQKAVAAGEDFDEAAAKQGYSPSLHTYCVGDELDKMSVFNDVMKGLDEGEVSDVIYIGDNEGIFLGCATALDQDSVEAAQNNYLLSEKLKVLKKALADWQKTLPVQRDEELLGQITMKKSLSAYQPQAEDDVAE